MTSTAFATISVAAAFVLLSHVALVQSACEFSCPKPYVAIGEESATCEYACATPHNFQCLGQLGKSIQCGGTTGTPCPAIACTSSYSAAFSGPTGCARAKSAINAFAISGTSVAFAEETFVKENEICTRDSPDSPVVHAQRAAKAYAEAIAFTVVNYNAYVCTCCTGNSAAYTVVLADVQAVAKAYADAFLAALGSVSCYGELLAGTSAVAGSFAADTQLAIDRVYQKYVSVKGSVCSGTGLITEVESAVAKAVACGFFQIYAAYTVANGNPADTSGTPNAYSCSATFALSGPGFEVDCPITC